MALRCFPRAGKGGSNRCCLLTLHLLLLPSGGMHVASGEGQQGHALLRSQRYARRATTALNWSAMQQWPSRRQPRSAPPSAPRSTWSSQRCGGCSCCGPGPAHRGLLRHWERVERRVQVGLHWQPWLAALFHAASAVHMHVQACVHVRCVGLLCCGQRAKCRKCVLLILLGGGDGRRGLPGSPVRHQPPQEGAHAAGPADGGWEAGKA